MKNFLKKINTNKKTILAVVLVCVVFIFFNIEPAAAGIGNAVATVLGWIAQLITTLLGYITLFLIKIMVNVAQFSDIINVPAVSQGWVLVRDLVNMFFVLIFLVIAFATILRIESYSAKKLLPKLLIMAVLINFSKTIFGLLIDFSQVIMLTFVSGFGLHGYNNFASIFRIQDMGTISPNAPGNAVSGWATSVGIIAGVFALIITLIVVIVMLGVLIMRVMMLWIYTILSPLVFLGFAFPPIQKYVGKIWEDFVKQLVVGPMLAFFLWLALTTAGSSANKIGNLQEKAPGSGEELCAGLNNLFCEGNFQTFIITIGLLIGGLMVTQQIGGAAGSIAGKGMAWARRAGTLAPAAAWWGAKTGAKWTGRQLDTAQMEVQKGAAWLADKATLGTFGKDYKAKSLNYRIIHDDWKKSRAEKMRDYEGGKVGAWQDTFNSFTATSVGIPIISKVIEKRAEKEIDKKEKERSGRLKKVENLENQQQLLDPYKEADEEKRINIQTEIDEEKNKIGEINDKIIELRKVDWRVGKMPKQKYARLEQQRRVNEEHSNIAKEDLDEDGLVDAYENETRRDKKRAYFQHLVDINGVNTLMAMKKIPMTSTNIRVMLDKDFGNEAGDAAADMAKRAEIKGNMALVGHAMFDIKSGMSKLVKTDEQQIKQAMKKDREKYSQNYARINHFDAIADRDANGNAENLSKLGEQQLLAIAKNTGRMAEIGKGNFQIRYGNTVVDMADNIQEKINFYTRSDASSQERAKGADLEKVLKAFKENYGGTKGGVVLKGAESGKINAGANNKREDLEKQMDKLKEDLKKTSGGIQKSQISNKIKDLEEKIKLQDKGQGKKTKLTDEDDD